VISRSLRAAAHLLLGGVVALPVAALGWLFVVAADGTATSAVLGVVALAGVAGVALLPVVRPLAVVAARTLLDVPLPEPAPGTGWSARRRAAGWLALQAVLGAATVLAVLVLVPAAAGFALLPITGGAVRISAETVWPATGLLRALGPVIGLVCLALLGVVVAALADLSRRLAPWFLGPTTAERLAAAREAALRAARRARLAGELHDGVGHVLTAVILQAGAARRVFDTDPDFARRALASIEERTRDAVADLDTMLGALREGTEPADGPGLEDLDVVVETVRAAGTTVTVEREGEIARVEPAVSAAALGVAREALTNAARHGDGAIGLDLRVDDDGGVRLTVTNPGVPRRTRPGGGRGLAGLAERVALVGGTVEAGPQDDHWVLHAELPAGAPP
jgi:signal transduction histidine kinase